MPEGGTHFTDYSLFLIYEEAAASQTERKALPEYLFDVIRAVDSVGKVILALLYFIS